jgi:glycosyltransferase involved in cell wall biosynthesis
MEYRQQPLFIIELCIKSQRLRQGAFWGDSRLGEVRAPLISVVVPTYNSAWSVGQTVASVLAQRFTGFELLIVDDGSTDDLGSALMPYLGTDARIRLIAQDNRGLAAARNRGLAEARGDYVAFLDADDLWHPEFLLSCLAALDRQPGAPFSYAYSHRIDARNLIISSLSWTREPRHDLVGLIEVNSVASGSASLFRRDLVAAAGGFDTKMHAIDAQGAEDWKLALTLAAKGTPALVPRELVAYRVDERSMSRSNPEVQLRGIRHVLDSVAKAHPGVPARHFRNARTVMNGWMLDAFLAKRMYGRAAALLFQSYALNPLWFLSRDVVAIHRRKIWSVYQGGAARKPLSRLTENGTRPFAFLDGTVSKPMRD